MEAKRERVYRRVIDFWDAKTSMKMMMMMMEPRISRENQFGTLVVFFFFERNLGAHAQTCFISRLSEEL